MTQDVSQAELKPWVIDLLACPHDGSRLTADVQDVLVCDEGHTFPVADGIPRMVPDAAPEEPSQTETATTFGAKWEVLREEDQQAMITFQHEWYDKRYGWGDEATLAEFLDDKETILDAGCGLGRDVARYARLCSANVIGFDLTSSVDRANRDFGAAPNAQYMQADILNPPFAPETFDFVVSDQVIHHTPDAHRAFLTLARLVKPGGHMAVYVYRQKGIVRELVDTHVRALTSAMTVDECMEFSEQVTELGRELAGLDAKVRLEKGVPLLGIEAGEHDVQRLIYWNFLKCFWNDDLGEHQSILGNFDWYHPLYASRHTADEVRGWVGEAGLELAHIDVIESGISIRATRSERS
jgi:SAM-dependent methyltransferase/uncharacterized protein YbaR (Trm112 family)